jgi:GrpB-like predicted nucleotidyltransferase (UPF0157 family)
MSELASSHETVGSTPNGPIVAIAFGGTYPPGSEGNDFARQMFEFVRTLVTETKPGAVVIDLSALDYVWGDAIGTLSIPLFGTGKDFRPVAIVATGRTAKALRPLLEPRFALGLLPCMALFESRREAVERLERALTLRQVLLKWAELERLFRKVAEFALPKSKHESGSIASIVDGLVSKGAVTGSLRSRIHAVADAHGKLLRGPAVPTEIQVRSIVDEIDQFLETGEALAARMMPTQQNTIQIVAYDPDWPAAFAAEAARLRTALGSMALRIDHHGSTAVPGLAAKPIIDIQISVASLQPLSLYGSKLEAIGYVHVPSADDSFCPFFHRPVQWPHTHHVHVVERNGHEERRTLAFRDYLRNHSNVAREYEELKRTIAAQVVGADAESREQYAVAKSDFVEQAVAVALAQGYPADLSDR